MDFDNPIKVSTKYFSTYLDSSVLANRILKTSEISLELHDSLISTELGIQELSYLDHYLYESSSALPTEPKLFGASIFFMLNEQHQTMVR